MDEPAFPVISDHGERLENHYGMGLRDYFAAKAMSAMIRYDAVNGNEFGWTLPEELSKIAYKYAQAMLVARDA